MIGDSVSDDRAGSEDESEVSEAFGQLSILSGASAATSESEPSESQPDGRFTELREILEPAELGQMILCFLHARKPDDPFVEILQRLIDIRASQGCCVGRPADSGIGRMVALAYCAKLIEPVWVLRALKRFPTQEGFVAEIAAKQKVAHDFTEPPFAESPSFLRFVEQCFWAASLLVFPIGWYVGAIPNVVDAEVSASC